jgi:hypothetical protein
MYTGVWGAQICNCLVNLGLVGCGGGGLWVVVGLVGRVMVVGLSGRVMVEGLGVALLQSTLPNGKFNL